MSLINNTTKLNEILEAINTMPEPEVAQTKIVAPSADEQVIMPDEGYKLMQVTVEETPYYEVENDNGGLTIYIGCAPPPSS